MKKLFLKFFLRYALLIGTLAFAFSFFVLQSLHQHYAETTRGALLDPRISLLQKDVLFITFFVAFLALILAAWLAQKMARPLEALEEAARKMAQGNLSLRIPPSSQNETGRIAGYLNEMADRLEESLHETADQRKALQQILTSLQEGLVVIGEDQKIKFWNKSFEEVIRNDALANRPYTDVIRDPGLSQMIQETLLGKKPFKVQVEMERRFFLCSSSYLEGRREVVVILYDLTSLEKAERMKRDLIVNVSHELRTPLTSIKGFIETLEEDVQGEGRKYLEIMKRNTERLIHIVRDLLALSEVETPDSPLDRKPVDLRRLIENILPIFRQKVEQKGLRLRFHTYENEAFTTGDAFKLEQAFINLIDNAVKYTDAGHVEITLRHEPKTNRWEVTVGDTGIGIPKEHLDRIFERFYVVDASRSRQTGGTGLGLSIVKHIVLLHQGTLQIDSLPGEGTTFTLSFPQEPKKI